MSRQRRVIAIKRLPFVLRAVFFALCAWAAFQLIGLEDGLVSTIGWIWFALAAWIAIRMALSALFPANLILSEDGFQIDGLKRRPLMRWSAIDRFWVLRTPLYGYVLYALVDQPRRENFGLWVFRGLPSEADGRLMPSYELKAEALLEELHVWKARYGT